MEVLISGVTIQGKIAPEGTLSGEMAPYIVKAQSKAAIPSTSEQVIRPDEGYDYLTEVMVSAVPYREIANQSGVTVEIGG